MAQRRLNTSLLLALGAFAGLLVIMAVAVSIGETRPEIGDTIASRLSTVVYLLASAGFAPGAYLLAALGLGRAARPLLPTASGEDRSFAPDVWALQLACGLGIMLTLSHLLGVLGLLDPSGGIGRIIAIAPIGAGLLLLAHQISKSDREASASLPWTTLLALPGIAVLLVASCSPPGWLWDSEFGGYDALSYHLQLPQEWLAMGRVWPVEHNVYAFLPSYVESAFVHLEVASGYITHPPLRGMIAGGGIGLISAQLLHAGLTLCAGMTVGALTRRLALENGLDARRSALSGGLGASLTILTPWSIVVGSLAYNEMAVVALGAGAVLAAALTEIRPLIRGALCGALVGCACGAKPTAIFMVGPPAAVILLGMSARSDWIRLVLGGAALGALVLAPWLIRNGIASGNPVFPAMSGLFGSGHWSGEQVARFAQKHSFDGSLIDRVKLMLLADANDPAGTRHRGLMHQHWSTIFIGVPFAIAAGLGLVGKRRVAWLLVVGLGLQLGAWLFLTHVQSRFLIPLGIIAWPLLGMAGAVAWPRRGGDPTDERAPREQAAWVVVRRIIVLAVGLPLIAAPIMTYAEQREGNPNQLLVLGPAYLTGEIAFNASDEDRAGFLQAAPPPACVNIVLPTGERVLMLGESAPLYYRAPIAYATTWDSNPLAQIIDEYPDPSHWRTALRADGYQFILIDFNMLGRFHASGEGDPRLDPQSITQWLERECALIRPWPDLQRALYRLPPSSPAGAPDPTTFPTPVGNGTGS